MQFEKSSLSYLKKLKNNNNRDWFNEHKPAFQVEQKKAKEFYNELIEVGGLEAARNGDKKFVNKFMELTQRDPQFIEYCERIAKYYFNGTIKQVNPMQAMMQNMMGGGGGANPMK